MGFYWADSSVEVSGDDFDEDAEIFDIPEHHLKEAEVEPYYIDHDAWEPWRVFLACANQWRYKPDGTPDGIDATSLKSVIDLYNPEDPLELFHNVRAVEFGVRAQLQGRDLLELLHG